jgi:AcrR family transcriptional regulator
LGGTSTNAEQLIDAALRLTVERGWRELTLPEIAAEAGVSLADAYTAFPTKMAMLNGFMARIDRQMLAEGAPDTAETVRDRLFDVVMRRFDALGPHKDAVAAIVDDLPADPLSTLAVLPAFGNSMAWTLEAAGVSASGLSGALRIQGLAIIYLTTLRTWLQDDTADAARTMATLDRALRRTEMLIRAFPSLRSHRKRRPDPGPTWDKGQSGEGQSGALNAGDFPSGDSPSGDAPEDGNRL